MAYNIHMKFFAILLLMTKVIPDTESIVVSCHGIIFNGTYFEKEELVKDVEKAYNLAVHASSDHLFFSHTIWDRTEIDFVVMLCELKTKFTRDLKGIPGGYAVAYDQAHDGMYIGGHDGIYKFNPSQNTITFFAAKDKSIWSIFVGNDIHYIEYPTQKLYVYKKGKFVREPAINISINSIFVSNNSEIFFSNDTALFKLQKLNDEPIILNDNITIKQISEDKRRNVFFCASDGIYIEDRPNNKLKKIAKLNNAYGMTFDQEDQVIFSNIHAIYRLLPSNYSKICIKAFENAEKEELKKRRSLMYNVMSLQ